MDQNNGLEAKFWKQETRTALIMELREIPAQLIKNSPPDQTSQIRTTIRILEDYMINAQTGHSVQAMEIDPEIGVSTMGMEAGETMETSLVLHRLVEEVSHKTNHTANQEVINLTIFLSADLTIDLRLVLLLTSKNSTKQ